MRNEIVEKEMILSADFHRSQASLWYVKPIFWAKIKIDFLILSTLLEERLLLSEEWDLFCLGMFILIAGIL